MDYVKWLLIIFYLTGFCCGSRTSAHANQRAQRRFMWKQMDATVDGIMDGMVSSARAMKVMFTDLMPTKPTVPAYSISYPTSLTHTNYLDYLPSETTRVKYIIRQPPPSKPMKIIKVRAPKKVIKIMTVAKPIIESKFHKPKVEHPSVEEMRKMEREQELIAEGRLPKTDSPSKQQQQQQQTKQQPQQQQYNSNKENDNIIRGQINNFGNDWRPVRGKLHTSIISGELLPEPQKQVLLQSVETEVHEPPQQQLSSLSHGYEVTEYQAEESMDNPQAHNYQNSRGFIPIRNVATTSPPTTTTQSRTTTSELPNYPAPFLRKIRERNTKSSPSSSSSSFTKSTALATPAPSRFRSNTDNNGWLPATNVTFANYKSKYQPPSASPLHSNVQRIKSESWPPVPSTAQPFVLAPQSANYQRTTTEVAQLEVRPLQQQRQVTRQPTTYKQHREYKPTNLRQRGSVKFGDKLNLE